MIPVNEMKVTTKLPPSHFLAWNLEHAVAGCWQDLMQGRAGNLIQLEYPGGRENPLRYLRIWNSPSRGEWDLIGEYSVTSTAFGETSVGFSSGTERMKFTRELNSILKRMPELSRGFELAGGQSLLVRSPGPALEGVPEHK